jgi:hypothetical protein
VKVSRPILEDEAFKGVTVNGIVRATSLAELLMYQFSHVDNNCEEVTGLLLNCTKSSRIAVRIAAITIRKIGRIFQNFQS